MDSIPRDTDGNIILDEYRETLWYAVKELKKVVPELSKTVEIHDHEIRTVKVISKTLSVIVGAFMSFLGYFKFFHKI